MSVAFASHHDGHVSHWSMYVLVAVSVYHATTAIVCRWVEVSNAVYYALVNDFMKPRIDEASKLSSTGTALYE